MAEPEALVSRQATIAARIALNHIAHAFLPGHRLRLAILDRLFGR